MTNALRISCVLALGLAACGKLPPASAGLGEVCARNADCAAPFVCGDGHCIVDQGRVCTPGARRCNGDALEACKTAGDGWALEEACATGCSESACRPKVCAAGSHKCEGGTVFQCLESGGGWSFHHACPTPCDVTGRECQQPFCHPFETQCAPSDPTRIQTCDARGGGFVTTSCTSAAGEAVCEDGRCRPKICTPAGGRCDGDVREACNALGSAFAPAEVCAFGCAAGACAAPGCAEGDLRCAAGALERCAPDRRSFAFVQFCPAGCAGTGAQTACVRPVCQPLVRLCATDASSGANIVQQCQADGSGFLAVESCPQACTQGTCVTDDAHCTPADRRCSGLEAQVCVRASTGTTQWLFEERCLGACQGGACDGTGACGCQGGAQAGSTCGSSARPVVTLSALLPAGAALTADGTSTVLVYTDPVVGADGTLVPDGTLVTFAQDGNDSLLASQDADPGRAGLQRPTLRGRARLVVRAPTQARDVGLTAGLGGSCTGTLSLHYGATEAGAHSSWVAEDFSTTRLYDRLATTATWDPLRGVVSASPPYGFGTGSDGDYTVATTTLHDLFDEGLATAWNVVGVGRDRVQTDAFFLALSPGDEVLLINLASSTTNAAGVAPSAGVYEFKRVARIESGAVVFVEPVQHQYGFSDNVDLTGQKVVVQRVPQFNNLTVESAATLTVRSFANNGSGVLALRARGTVRVLGTMTVAERGLPPGVAQTGATIGALPRLLLGGGQSKAGGGILFVNAKTVTVKPDSGAGFGTVSASSTGGGGGTLWLGAASLVLGVNNATATGSTQDGRVRLDDVALDTGATTRPAAFVGQSGSFIAQSLLAYAEPPVGSGAQPLVRAVTLLGVVGGAARTAVGLPAVVTGLHVDVSVDGAPFQSADVGRLQVTPAGKAVRFRARLEALTDDPVELLGVAFKIEAS